MIEKGIGDKLALFFQYSAVFVTGFVVGFVYGWELTLVIVAVSPLLAISGGFMGMVGVLTYLHTTYLAGESRCNQSLL